MQPCGGLRERAPAARDDVPVLAAVKAPRSARPLRASALTAAAHRQAGALIAGAPRPGAGRRADAIPLTPDHPVLSSLDVPTAREDAWDRDKSVPGFSACRDSEWSN